MSVTVTCACRGMHSRRFHLGINPDPQGTDNPLTDAIWALDTFRVDRSTSTPSHGGRIRNRLYPGCKRGPRHPGVSRLVLSCPVSAHRSWEVFPVASAVVVLYDHG